MRKEYGTKYVCFNCAAMFYDLGTPRAICPICDSDQNKRPKKKERKTFQNYVVDSSSADKEKEKDAKEHEKAVLMEMETPLLDKEIGDGDTIKVEEEEE